MVSYTHTHQTLTRFASSWLVAWFQITGPTVTLEAIAAEYTEAMHVVPCSDDAAYAVLHQRNTYEYRGDEVSLLLDTCMNLML